MQNTILLDLDGVLVDFVRGVQKHHKREDIPYADIRWGLESQFGFEEPEKFWASLGFAFWAGLPWHPKGKEFLSKLIAHFGRSRIMFCTSPCQTAGCIDGKMAWLKREIPDMARMFIITPKKDLIASPALILIDDYEPNVDKFVAAGGQAVLVPQPWNRNAKHLDDKGDYRPGDLLAATNLLAQGTRQ